MNIHRHSVILSKLSCEFILCDALLLHKCSTAIIFDNISYKIRLCMALQRQVPWGHLIRCWRFYPSILAEFASSWVTNQTTTEGPTFLKTQVMTLHFLGKWRSVSAILYGGKSSARDCTYALVSGLWILMILTYDRFWPYLLICRLGWQCQKWVWFWLQVKLAVGWELSAMAEWQTH